MLIGKSQKFGNLPIYEIAFAAGEGGGACRLKRERKKERNNNRVRTAHLYLFPIASATNRKTSDGELAPVSGRNEERRHQ